MGRARFLTCVLLVLVSLLVTGSSNFVGVLLRGFNNDDVNEPPLINLQSPVYYYYNIENGVIRGVALSFWSDIVNPVVSSIFNFVYKTIHFLINTYVIFKLLQKWSSPTRCKPHHRRCRRQPHHGGGGGGGGRLIRLQHKHCDPLVRRGGKHKHTTTLLVHNQDKQSAPSLLPDDGETSLRHWTLGSSSAHDDSRVEYFDRESMTLQSTTAADNSFSFPLLQSSSSTSKGGSNHPNWNSPPHLQSEIQQEEEHLIQPDLPTFRFTNSTSSTHQHSRPNFLMNSPPDHHRGHAKPYPLPRPPTVAPTVANVRHRQPPPKACAITQTEASLQLHQISFCRVPNPTARLRSLGRKCKRLFINLKH